MKRSVSQQTRKQQLIDRIVDISRILGSDVTELFYEDYEISALENELEILEEQLEDEY